MKVHSNTFSKMCFVSTVELSIRKRETIHLKDSRSINICTLKKTAEKD